MLVHWAKDWGWNLACLLLISFEFPYLCSSLFLPGLTSEGRGHAGVTGGIVPGTGKNIVVSVSIWRDALLEGEIAEARRAWEVAEERFFRLMNSSSEGVQRLVAYKVGHHEQFKDLSLL
jgi:hypothetical protein